MLHETKWGDEMSSKKIKLPFWSTIRAAHTTIASNVSVVVRITWPWLLFLAVLTAIFSWYYFPYYDVEGETFTNQDMFALLFDLFIPFIAAMGIAVAWHRFILRDEATTGGLVLKNSGSYIRYFFIALVLFMIAIIPIILPAVIFWLSFSGLPDGTVDAILNQPVSETNIASPSPDEITPEKSIGLSVIASFITIIIMLPFMMLFSYFPARLIMALPASAVGEKDGILRASWQLTKGNFIRLFGASVILSWPYLIAAILLVTAFGIEQTERIPFVIDCVLSNTMALVAGLLYVGFLSHSYQYLTGRQDEKVSEPPYE